jgi:predicted nicotinamide N-methyase
MEATRYAGPVVTTEVMAGGRLIRLVRPADPDRMLEEPGVLAWNRVDDYMPYWAYLWPGAFLLAEAVAREPWQGGLEALEIGCGLGLAGMVGLTRGLRVKFTDYDLTPLDFVARSALANGFDPSRFSTARLDWRDPPEERYSVILGADVLYEHRLVPLVASVLARMLASGGLALIADPYRVAAKRFPAAVEGLGLVCENRPITADSEELGALRGTLHRVTRRA